MSSEYTRIKHPTGYRYLKKGRMISVRDVPQDVVDSFTDEEPTKSDRKCVFCGEHSKYYRLVNNRSVYICNEHYYSKSLGQVAQKLL